MQNGPLTHGSQGVFLLGPFLTASMTIVLILDTIKASTMTSRITSIGSISMSTSTPVNGGHRVAAVQSISANAAKAYVDAYTRTKDVLKNVVDSLTDPEMFYLRGLGYNTDPTQDKSHREDVLNSALAAYDAAASEYMKGHYKTGDDKKAVMLTRYAEFDNALITSGKPPVTPDA